MTVGAANVTVLGPVTEISVAGSSVVGSIDWLNEMLNFVVDVSIARSAVPLFAGEVVVRASFWVFHLMTFASACVYVAPCASVIVAPALSVNVYSVSGW